MDRPDTRHTLPFPHEVTRAVRLPVPACTLYTPVVHGVIPCHTHGLSLLERNIREKKTEEMSRGNSELNPTHPPAAFAIGGKKNQSAVWKINRALCCWFGWCLFCFVLWCVRSSVRTPTASLLYDDTHTHTSRPVCHPAQGKARRDGYRRQKRR